MRKLASLTLILALAFFAGEAAAQCSGKTVYLEAPIGWGDNGKVYYIADNIYSLSNISHEGRWLVIKFPSTFNNSNDRADLKFAFLFDSAFADHPGTKWIYAGGYDERRDQRIQTGTGGFSCNNSAFSSDGKLYIYPDPNNPTKTLTSTTVPNIYYFYFLPPDDDDWILSTPYLVIGNTKKAMSYDEKKCGWYKLAYFQVEPPNGDAVIWPGPSDPPKYQIGLYGLDEDPLDWPGSGPTPFKLKEQFDRLNAKEIYFVAQNGIGGWTAIDPIIEEKQRCNYSFAAIIYQRSSYSNTNGFSWYTGPGDPGFGICKGLAQETLVNGKMQWNKDCNVPRSGAPGLKDQTGSYNSGWENGTNFANAFKETPGQNTVKCYDMPFQKRPGGLWEFDAFYLCKDGNTTDYSSTYTTGCGASAGGTGSVGGFYNMKSNDGTALGARRDYDGDRIGVKDAYKWCFDRGWSGKIGSAGIGDLSNKNTKAELDAEMKRVCSDSLRTGNEPQLYTTGINDDVPAHDPGWNSNQVAKGVSGGHLCFESQDAEFTYEKGQEFFFRGDDDIWIFINNQLVIDLGGNHMPAPGYVKLDTISKPERLVEGKKYPIKIFFCDRRGPGSNVRISTNMYFSQKSGLSLKEGTSQIFGEVCLESSGGGSCAAASSGGPKEICGNELNNKLNYYIAKMNGSQRQELDSSNPSCSNSGGNMVCFGSITINLAGGKVGIDPTKTTGVVGTWVVWAEVKDGVVEPKPSPLRLGTISGRTYIQAVWGTIKREDNGQTITTIPYKTFDGKVGMQAVASKLVKVGFAEGGWGDSDPSGSNAIFQVLETSKGTTVSLQPSGSRDPSVQGSGIRVFRDSAGTQEASFGESFTIPDNGVLELWFTGEFTAHSTATYEIDARASGLPFALRVHQPRIAFVNNNNDSIPQSERWGSDPTKPGNAPADRIVYIFTPLSRNIAAFDPVDGGICTTCSFAHREVETETSVRYQGNNTIEDRVIEFNDKRIENGVGRLEFSGTVAIERDSTALFTVGGPSPDPSTISTWRDLQFREPPTPFPTAAFIFDRNGDGKGDSIRIVYNRQFPRSSAGTPDTLPNKLQVVWARGDTANFGLGSLVGSSYTYTGSSSDNWNYWKDYLREGKGTCDGRECPDTLVITVSNDAGSKQFSEEIKTAARGGENVLSWSTFQPDGGGSHVTQSFISKITDRIPPIIVRAEYQADEEAKCGTLERKCRDRIFIELSEKVKMAPDVSSLEDVKRAFAYYLIADPDERKSFKVYEDAKSLATGIVWTAGKTSRANFPESDSSVQLTYLQYKTETDNSLTPVPNDSVRFLARGASPGSHAFVDLEGNYPNPAEIGRKIEGRGRFNTDRNLIANADPDDKELAVIKKKMEERFGGGSGFSGKINELFSAEKPIEFLPIPESWKNNVRDSITKYYPGTVGVVFWPGVVATLSEDKYKNVNSEEIEFIANSFYHTNLGNFAVKSNEVRVKCNDPVFQIDGQGDCRNSNGLYLAWDLRDNKGRTVGTGAYVQVYNFRWEVKVAGKVEAPNKYPSEGNKIEMFGVKRTKGTQQR